MGKSAPQHTHTPRRLGTAVGATRRQARRATAAYCYTPILRSARKKLLHSSSRTAANAKIRKEESEKRKLTLLVTLLKTKQFKEKAEPPAYRPLVLVLVLVLSGAHLL